MPIKIPLNSLVFSQDADCFPKHEHLSKPFIEFELAGDRIVLPSLVFEELRHRVALKLSLGERVVVSGTLSADEKQTLTRLATAQGSPVIETVSPVAVSRFVAYDWHGITVVGDLHGNLDGFKEAAQWAKSRRHFLWVLGDILDYGAKTLETMTAVYHAVMAGDAALIVGNHERKIARWLEQREQGKIYVRLSDGNRITTRALERLNQTKQQQWVGQFRNLLTHATLSAKVHDVTLIHGAVHPSLWSSKPDQSAIEKYALYGEAEHKDGRYHRTHRWIDHVPKDQTVIVGHDILHSYPLVKTGAKGGTAIFLDTGSGKGGYLTSADLRFSGTDLKLECFKRY